LAAKATFLNRPEQDFAKPGAVNREKQRGGAQSVARRSKSFRNFASQSA
jgi:hypothetical protein